jgi:hypothetical protein
MRTGQHLMERLAAADPLPGAENLNAEEQREAEALLAQVLSSPAEERTVRPARFRRRALLVGAVACAAAATVAALDLFDSAPGGPGVVDRAVAAVSRQDVVYHVLERSHPEPRLPGQPNALYTESWHTPDGRRHIKTFTTKDGRPGSLVSEFAGMRRPDRRSGPLLRYDPKTNTISRSGFGTSGGQPVPLIDPFEDPGASLRNLEEQGRLRLARTSRIGGRQVYRLESGTVRSSEGETVRVEFLVDYETYLPVARRFSVRQSSGETMKLVTRYLVYERLPRDDRSLRLLDLDPHPGAKCAPGAGELREHQRLGFENPCPPKRR